MQTLLPSALLLTATGRAVNGCTPRTGTLFIKIQAASLLRITRHQKEPIMCSDHNGEEPGNAPSDGIRGLLTLVSPKLKTTVTFKQVDFLATGVPRAGGPGARRALPTDRGTVSRLGPVLSEDRLGDLCDRHKDKIPPPTGKVRPILHLEHKCDR